MEDVDVGIVTNVVAKRNRSAIVKSVAARRNRNVIVKNVIVKRNRNAIVNRKGINNKKSTLSTLSFYKVIFHHQQIFLQFSIYLVF
ncbi:MULTISPECIES: hypothetical protein [Bacillus]|uniref:Uncharacterized protein n=6 Tax=Bacillus cereus group TaxID=86661 RepID=A0A6L7H4Q3_BACAN|nr:MULTISPECIES: hypothetical protein [Bacillus]AJZ69252.1 hypothetical protein A16R_59555 [Bacillus anthracis str. A16R]OTW43811.1 hypothetical protein BK699_34355 [Bacillus thuringiensis serovar mexicanensis]OTX02892.1 hypothetical protein BK705_17005 [Bacillus thuringiensis serovar monterrey]OTX33150.1 hypothetical protein BK720_12010 [Bacillus thuringiensis serovar brasilensis]OUA99837.1 hypothetical protein BK714_09465 [Bacillus thuringiensis serovar oswaldocruzi]TEA53039.1 hypothetical 